MFRFGHIYQNDGRICLLKHCMTLGKSGMVSLHWRCYYIDRTFPTCSLTSLQKGCAIFVILKGTFLSPPSIFGCTKMVFFDGAIDGN